MFDMGCPVVRVGGTGGIDAMRGDDHRAVPREPGRTDRAREDVPGGTCLCRGDGMIRPR